MAGVKLSFLARNSLHDNPCVLVNEYTHFIDLTFVFWIFQNLTFFTAEAQSPQSPAAAGLCDLCASAVN
jgi:hypothetical protein